MATVRTAVYGGLAGYLGLTTAEAKGALDAAIFGAVLADFSTWGLRSLALLPSYLWHGCWEGCVNVAFGYVYYRLGSYQLDTDMENVALAFVVFLFVAALKVSYYAVQAVMDSTSDIEP